MLILLIPIFTIAASKIPPMPLEHTLHRLVSNSERRLPVQPQPAIHSAQATGPLRVNPANPRYFTDGSGRAILLTGSHTWFSMQDGGYSDPPAMFDFDAYLDWLVSHGHNFFKSFSWMNARWDQATDQDWYNNPMPYQRTGPGNALDGKPKFDLDKFNQAYFDRIRDRVIRAGNRGIYVSVQFWYGFSFDEKDSWGLGDAWPGHAFNASNNVNGIDADPTHKGDGEDFATLNDPRITAYQEAYVRKMIDTLNDLDNVIWEICNEPRGNIYSRDWQYHFVDYVHAYEATKPKQHPVGMTVAWPSGNNNDLFNSNAEWISPNGDGGYRYDPPAADGSKVILTDTDHIWGVGGKREWVWKSFTRGLNPTFMDPYDCVSSHAQYNTNGNCNPDHYENVRYNLGYTLSYANRMNLAAMTPRGDLCSTGYCLANPLSSGAEYLVYAPSGGTITVNLSDASGELSVEWFNPSNGITTTGGTTTGGANRSFTTPFNGDAVLYIFPPAVTNVAAYPSETLALVTWNTHKPATSQVAYGISPTLSMSTTETIEQVTLHQVLLIDLMPNTTYVYKVYSKDATGALATSEILSFTTLDPADATRIYLPLVLKLD